MNLLGTAVGQLLSAAVPLANQRSGRQVTAFIPDPSVDGSQDGVTADANGNVDSSLTVGMALKKYVRD